MVFLLKEFLKRSYWDQTFTSDSSFASQSAVIAIPPPVAQSIGLIFAAVDLRLPSDAIEALDPLPVHSHVLLILIAALLLEVAL